MNKFAATQSNLQIITDMTNRYPQWSDFKLKKVWLCQNTNSIKARFEQATIGQIQGTVKSNFEVRETMIIDSILENVTLEDLVLTDIIVEIVEAYVKTKFE